MSCVAPTCCSTLSAKRGVRRTRRRISRLRARCWGPRRHSAQRRAGLERRDGATVAAFAAEICRLLLAGEEIDDIGALPRICAWLRSRLDARSVAVYLSGRTRVPVAVSGPAERFDAVVVPAASSAHCIPLIRLGRGQGYGLATDIGGKDEPVGTLLARVQRPRVFLDT